MLFFQGASRYADDTTLMVESKEELKSLLMNMKEESEKVGLKLKIQKLKIMASGPITLWQIDGETVTDFIFEGSKMTAVSSYIRVKGMNPVSQVTVTTKCHIQYKVYMLPCTFTHSQNGSCCYKLKFFLDTCTCYFLNPI